MRCQGVRKRVAHPALLADESIAPGAKEMDGLLRSVPLVGPIHTKRM